MARDEETIAKTFTNYAQAFQTLNPQAMISYCHLPCMLISSQGVLVMEDPAGVEALFTKMAEGLKTRGYARSELRDFHLKQVSANTAFLSVSRVRYKTDGQELERFSETYTFRNTVDGWKIAVATIHDSDTTLQLA